MALIKNTAGKDKPVRTVAVNYNQSMIERFKKWDGKSLVEIDATNNLTSLEIGRSTWESPEGDVEIINLVLGMKGEKIAFPVSRGFTEDIDNDPTALLDGEFYVRNKFDETKDTEGNYPYSGPLYISFGKPAGLTMELKSLVGVEAVAE